MGPGRAKRVVRYNLRQHDFVMHGPPDLEAGFCVILKRGNVPARSRHAETLGSPHGGGQVLVSSELGV